jgi:hypothetical protein
MAKPLRLFIRPPYNTWRLVHSFGPEQPSPPPPYEAEFYDYAVLSTTGDGQLYAVADGKLSVVLPCLAMANDPTLPVTKVDPTAPLPATVNLYLHSSPTYGWRKDFRERAAGIHGIAGYAYLNVETASLEGDLAELLDAALIPAGHRNLVIQMLVRGMLDLRVTAGHKIGKASPEDAPAGERLLGFTVLTNSAPLDPAYTYFWMRDFVEGDQNDLDALLDMMPELWPVIDPNMGTGYAIAMTETSLYNMTVLEELRESRQLNASQWRQVGNNQKALYRKRLLSRLGHAPSGSADPPFSFNDFDWKNTFQLEAVVEFYMNFDCPATGQPCGLEKGDPWATGARPSNPGDGAYITVNFLDPAGMSATDDGNVVTLDGDSDLSRVQPGCDILWLKNAVSGSDEHKFIIRGIDPASRQVLLDVAPQLSQESPWKIILLLRPTIVIIDPFGGRVFEDLRVQPPLHVNLNGRKATVIGIDWVQLEEPVPYLDTVNPGSDTIYFPSDKSTSRPSRTYRILGRTENPAVVRVDGNPEFEGGTSAWHIPAGIGGNLQLDPATGYNLEQHGGHGYDHYDGMLFVIKSGEVRKRFRWSSFSSRESTGEVDSSVRGNRTFDVESWHEEDHPPWKNYCFKVWDIGAGYDGVREARRYFRDPVVPDTAPPGQVPGTFGKTGIRLHQGNEQAARGHPGNGSTGCLVSPGFGNPPNDNFRALMIRLYQEDYMVINGRPDSTTQPLEHINHSGAMQLSHTVMPPAAWNGKLKATLWLIRPDEKPEG